jgi:hypothetical protein
MIDVEELLMRHSGVKGMKWGQRRAQKKADRADKKWQNNIYSIQGAVAIHNNVADKMNNGGLARLNAAHPNAHLDHDTPATRAYLKAYEKMNEEFTLQAVKEVHGTSPSGGYKTTVDTSDPEQFKIVITPTHARHGVQGTRFDKER